MIYLIIVFSPKSWVSDFYLKHFGVYIEVCGSEKFDYEYRSHKLNEILS